MEYPKTENLYARDPENPKRVGPEFGLRLPEVDLVSKWLVLEKVDGMNMRVFFEPIADEPVRILGRTDRATVPGDLLESIRGWATFPNLASAFEDEDGLGPAKAILFGEGYGAGIQKGGHYRPDKAFVLFDVVVFRNVDSPPAWLSWVNVVDVAAKLGITHVPALARGVDLETAKACVGVAVLTSPELAEGIVARTDPYLFTSRGHRVAFKYKVRDLAEAA